MRELSLHLLDIAENGIAAGATLIRLIIDEDLDADLLQLTVEDDGRGMDDELLKRITDPFVTSRTTRRVGLGIPLLKAAAESCNGSFQIESVPGQGTKIYVAFQHSHLDRAPLGDMTGTVLTMVVGYPKVDVYYRHRVNGVVFEFDSRPIKEELGDIPLSDPAVLAFLRGLLEEGDAELRSGAAS